MTANGSTSAINCSHIKNRVIRIYAPKSDTLEQENSQITYYRDSPERNCVVLKRVSEISEHILSNKTVKGFDDIQNNFNDYKQQKDKPVMHVEPCDRDSMGSYRMST